MIIRRLYIQNIHFLKLKNVFANLFIKGRREPGSRVWFFGKSYYKVHKTAKINIRNGFLCINRFVTRKDPFIGNLEMFENSTINVKNTFFIHSGCDIMIFNNAQLNLGGGYINRYCKIRCYNNISIGKDVAISDNFTIWDSDAHTIIVEEKKSVKSKSIKIGDNVWIGANVTVLKGVNIGNGSVIAAGSVVNRDIPGNCMAGGVPAKVLKYNVNWK